MISHLQSGRFAAAAKQIFSVLFVYGHYII